MSLSRKITLLFVLMAAGMLLLVVANVNEQADRARKSFEDEVLIPTSRVLARTIRGSVEKALARLLEESRGQGAAIAVDIGDLGIWDEAELRALLDKAVIVHSTPTDTALYNPRPALIFERDAKEVFDKPRLRSLLAEAKRKGPLPFRDATGRWVVCGRFRSQALSEWGFLFRLSPQHLTAYDPSVPVRSILVILLVGMGTMLLVFLWIVERSLLMPLMDTEKAALRVSAGDYDHPLPYGDRPDEIGSIARALNLMMKDLALYRGHMESLVAEANEKFRAAERHLVLTQRLAAMGRIAAGIAHEINNPLGGVINAARRISHPDLDPARRQKYVQVVEEGLERIRAIVQRVLDTTPRQTSVQEVPLDRVLDQSVGLIQHRLTKEGVEVVLRGAEGLSVLGDPRELGQVFLNLLINALDAMDGKGGKVEIDRKLRTDRVAVTVVDSGPGIPDEDRDRVFDLFFTTKPGQKGSGLGLGIVHNIVTGHGGRVSLVPSPLGGAGFLVELPAAPDHSSD